MEKYPPPLIVASNTFWGWVKIFVFPVGYAGTILHRGQGSPPSPPHGHLTAAVSTVRSYVEHSRAIKGAIDPDTDHNAKIHDYNLCKPLLDSLTDLAQSRLICINRNRKRLVDALPREVNRHLAHSVASPTPTLAARQEGVAPHTHRTRSTRVPESTTITSS